MMRSAVLSLLVSLVASLVLLRWASRCLPTQALVPARTRPISGVAAILGLCAGWLSLTGTPPDAPLGVCLVLLPALALPAFFVGMTVDCWRPWPLRLRMLVTAVVGLASAACVTPDGRPFAMAVLVIAGAGAFVTLLTHAMAVVDQRNGAAALCVLLIQSSLAYVAHQVGDQALMVNALIVVGAVLGVCFFGFQANLASLGRSGCALLGFITAAMALMLVARNPSVSVWLPALLCAHPALEAAWAWHRRRQGKSQAATPSLVYRRLVRWATGNPPDRRQAARDSGVGPHLWMLSIVGIAPALLWWHEPLALLLALAFRVGVQVAAVKLLSGLPTAAPDRLSQHGPLQS